MMDEIVSRMIFKAFWDEQASDEDAIRCPAFHLLLDAVLLHGNGNSHFQTPNNSRF